MKTVYADNAASTPISQEVLDAMQESYEHYSNPSCNNAIGQKSRKLIENARSQIAESIGAQANEIIFTSGGTESNNLAILGYVDANRGNHIITTDIEHVSVLNPINELYHDGYDVTYLPVDSKGRINPKHLIQAIRRNTVLISIMFANNEIGTIQPIKDIGNIAKQYNICFHTDAVQAFLHCDIDVCDIGIDMMSISGHKINAPKGVGVLYARNNVKLRPLIFGKGQEFNLRSGTENLSGIVGMGKAVESFQKINPELKHKLISGIIDTIPDVKYNGCIDNGLPGIANFSFKGISGKELIAELSNNGIYVSNSEICGYGNPSHVLTAIGLPNEYLYGAVRFSFGRYNTENELSYLIDTLTKCVNNLRNQK